MPEGDGEGRREEGCMRHAPGPREPSAHLKNGNRGEGTREWSGGRRARDEESGVVGREKGALRRAVKKRRSYTAAPL